jgi:dCMP deaminase
VSDVATKYDVNQLCLRCGCWTPEGEAEVHARYCPVEETPVEAPDPPAPALTVADLRPSWDEYFFTLARVVAQRATCPRAAIGCVIVHPDLHWVLATGYNGAQVGDPHCTEVGCTILADHCVRARHAEANAADQILRSDRLEDGLVAYVIGPRPPCSHCSFALYTAGVRDVRWQES